MHDVVYIGNSSYFFFFFFFFVVVSSCFSQNNRIIFVILFLFFTLECIVTTSFDKFELQCQKKAVSSQRNSSDPFEIQTLCSFHQVRYLGNFVVHARTRHRQQMVLSLQDFQTLPQKVGTENCCLT